MKLAFFEVPAFIITILLAVTLLGKDFNKSTSIKVVNIKINEIPTCIEGRHCITESKETQERKGKFNIVREMKNFLRQKIN